MQNITRYIISQVKKTNQKIISNANIYNKWLFYILILQTPKMKSLQ